MIQGPNEPAERMTPNGLLDDTLFKIVFGSQSNQPILRALLNALLGYTGDNKIVEIAIVSPELQKVHQTDKGSFLDLRAVDGTGKQYNVEVQLDPGRRDNFIKRTIYYLARLFASQLVKGDSYGKLAKSICISILDFNLFPESDPLHSTFHLRNDQTNELLTDIIELHYVELRKFSSSKPHHLRSPFERWLHVLKFSNLYAFGDEPLPENLEQEEGISMAIDALKDAYADEEVRELIRIREKARKDYLAGLEDAHDEGLEKGLERGLEQGLEQGLEKGLERGREEGDHLARLKVAASMLEDGLSNEQIERFTGLTPEQLQSLRKERS